MYLNGKNYALNTCIDSQNYRVHLTTHSKPNPQVAPNFCMLLRKNIIGLRLKNVITLDLERIIILELEGFDEIDDIITKKLIIELMGKHSNIMLLDDQNIIQDSLRHIKETDENFRDILPHTKYSFPTCDKQNFMEVTNFSEFYQEIQKISVPDYETTFEKLPLLLSNLYNGFSKNFIEYILNELKIPTCDNIFASVKELEKIYEFLSTLINMIGTNHLKFVTFEKSNKNKKDYAITTTPETMQDFCLNFFIDDFYAEKETSESFKNYRNTILRLILETLKKYTKRLANMDEKLKECENMDTYRIYGELITANLYRIQNQNVDMVEVENYYNNNEIIKIPLDKKYSPSVNAKHYFKKYTKLKNALEIVSKQKKETLQELDYIESIVYELESCSNIQEVSDIFGEISENIIFKEKTSQVFSNKKLKIKKSNLTKNKTVSFNPLKYTIDGYTVLVGRNNKENDYLTLKFAQKKDIWFHTQDIHGSHVILKLDNNHYPSNDSLIKVAQIAAFHSKARNSSNVPVDFCEVRFVKKPNGAKPGMVIYTNQHTLNVQPKI